jgi:hypothetical protein
MGDRAPGVFRLAQRRRTFRRGRCVGLMNGVHDPSVALTLADDY